MNFIQFYGHRQGEAEDVAVYIVDDTLKFHRHTATAVKLVNYDLQYGF